MTRHSLESDDLAVVLTISKLIPFQGSPLAMLPAILQNKCCHFHLFMSFGTVCGPKRVLHGHISSVFLLVKPRKAA